MSRTRSFLAGFSLIVVAGILLWFFASRDAAFEPKPPKAASAARRPGAPPGTPRIRGQGESIPIERPPGRAGGSTGGAKAEPLEPEDKKGIALKILDLRLAMHDPRRMMERGEEDPRKLFSAMGPDLAAHFIEEFRTSEGERRQTALFLAIEAGGADAAAFLKEILNGGIVPAEERLLVLRSLPGIPSIGGLPADDETIGDAYRMVSSGEPDERKGAAGLLGWQDTAQARVTLMDLAGKDPDSWVKAAALRSLGRNGDRSVLNFLQAYPREGLDQEYWVGGALEDAIAQIERRLGEASSAE